MSYFDINEYLIGYFYKVSALIVYTHIKLIKNGIVMNKMILGCETLRLLIKKNNYDVVKAIDKFRQYENLIGNGTHLTNDQLKVYLLTILYSVEKEKKFHYH